VLDLSSRRVVGWACADHLRTELPEQALRAALAQAARRLRGHMRNSMPALVVVAAALVAVNEVAGRLGGGC
jgi:hypothetical protein